MSKSKVKSGTIEIITHWEPLPAFVRIEQNGEVIAYEQFSPPQRPNTDSRELKEIERILDFFDDPEVIAAEILAYTANKQKELLEWVEQEVVGADLAGVGETKPQPNDDTPGMIHGQAQNALRAAQRNQLKNKKESLS